MLASHFMHRLWNNQIGNAGAKGLGEALKTNIVLTALEYVRARGCPLPTDSRHCIYLAAAAAASLN